MNDINVMNDINFLIDEISLKLSLETDKKKITPINSIKITMDLLDEHSFIKKTFEKYYSVFKNDKRFVHLYDVVTNNKYMQQIILSNNHYDNPLLNIYFIIGNPHLFHLDIFNIVYENRNFIKHIPYVIKKAWNYIINSDLKKYFNQVLIDKWLKNLEFKMLTIDDILHNNDNTMKEYKKYVEIFALFRQATDEVITFVLDLKKIVTSTQNPGGCINLGENYYLTFQKTYSGLSLDNKKLIILVKFAQKELTNLLGEMKNILINIYPVVETMNSCEMISFLQNLKDHRYKSREEYISHHASIMKDMEKYFIDDKNIKQFVSPRIVVIDNHGLGGAYWAYDTFYLNVCNWKNINKYQALSLTLHEAIPGHHTQVSYQMHSLSDGYDLLYDWFGTTSGFHEGWALFAEKLAPKYTEMEKIGRIQYEILRTIRVIVDISLHGAGIPSDEIKQFMQKYLVVPETVIESEIYRYTVLPGQASGYKIGETIFRKIHKKILPEHDYLSDESFDLYKKILYSKAKPLDLLLDDFGMTFDEIFS